MTAEGVPTSQPCRPCAGTGEYPPTDGDVCSWCDGAGEVTAEGVPTSNDDSGGSVNETGERRQVTERALDPNSDEFKRANPVLAEVREMVAPGKRIEQVSFSIDWMSFDNDDLGDDLAPDEGWYVTIEAPNGSGGFLGPDHFGPGLPTVDAALDLCRKWAEDRGYTFSRPSVAVTVGRFV